MYYECGDGWKSLINEALQIVKEYNENHTKLDRQVVITNIKEENGCLVFSFKPYIAEIAMKLYNLEKQSLRICEMCGSKNNVSNEYINGSMKTLCTHCIEKINN